MFRATVKNVTFPTHLPQNVDKSLGQPSKLLSMQVMGQCGGRGFDIGCKGLYIYI